MCCLSLADRTSVAQIASLEKQIKDANSEARRAPLIAQLNALKGGSSYSDTSSLSSYKPASSFSAIPTDSKDVLAKIDTLKEQIRDALKAKGSSYSSPPSSPAAKSMSSSPSSYSSVPVADKEVAAKIAALERQIKDANSEARRAPLIAQLNSIRGVSSYSAPQSSAKPTVAPSASFTTGSVVNKELAAKVAALEKQIKDANSEARKAPLIAQLNALMGGSSYSAPQPSAPVAAARPAVAPSASFTTGSVMNKELAAKVAALERQIKDANSEARKAPLIAQLNALMGSSSYSSPQPSTPVAAAKPAVAPSASFTSSPVMNKELAAQVASLERQIKDANSEARRAPLIAQLNSIRGGPAYSAPQASAPVTSAKPTSFTPSAASFTATPIVNKELAAKVAALEKQIKDANSEARKAPLIAQLNALMGGSSYSAPQPSVPVAAARPAVAPSASFTSSPVVNKELAAKIASLEKQIKDANSEARKAPLIAQLNAIRGGGSSYSAAPQAVAKPVSVSAPPTPYAAPPAVRYGSAHTFFIIMTD